MTVLKIRHFIFIIFSLALLSCDSSLDPVTKEFEAYLKSHLQLSAQNGNVYCMIPGNGCRYTATYNTKPLPSTLKNHFVIISGFPESDYRNFPVVYSDESGELMKLDFLDFGKKLVVYNNDRVTSVLKIRDLSQQLDSLSQCVIP